MAPGWLLSHTLLADVALEVLQLLDREAAAASSSADEAWLLVSFLANDRCRDNVTGLPFLLLQLFFFLTIVANTS